MPVSSAKDRQYSFVLGSDELRALHEVAEAAGQSAADWLRSAIRKGAKAAGVAMSRGPVRNQAWGPRGR